MVDLDALAAALAAAPNNASYALVGVSIGGDLADEARLLAMLRTAAPRLLRVARAAEAVLLAWDAQDEPDAWVLDERLAVLRAAPNGGPMAGEWRGDVREAGDLADDLRVLFERCRAPLTTELAALRAECDRLRAVVTEVVRMREHRELLDHGPGDDGCTVGIDFEEWDMLMRVTDAALAATTRGEPDGKENDR